MTVAAPARDTRDPHDRAPIELPHRVRLEILGAVLLGILLAALDQTIVTVALPSIVTDLEGNDVFVRAIHEALSIATAATFVVGIATALLAAALVLGFLPAGKVGEQVQPRVRRSEVELAVD